MIDQTEAFNKALFLEMFDDLDYFCYVKGAVLRHLELWYWDTYRDRAHIEVFTQFMPMKNNIEVTAIFRLPNNLKIRVDTEFGMYAPVEKEELLDQVKEVVKTYESGFSRYQ